MNDVTGYYREGWLVPGQDGPVGVPLLDLPDGAVVPFPCPGGDVVICHLQARNDFDLVVHVMLAGGGVLDVPLVNGEPPNVVVPPVFVPDAGTSNAFGPNRSIYYVENLTHLHEDFHVEDFFLHFWPRQMEMFRTDTIENPMVSAIFYNCNIAVTTTKDGVLNQEKPNWDREMRTRHDATYTDYAQTDAVRNPADPNPDNFVSSGAEVRDHRVTNPMYEPIRNAIPIP